MSDIPPNPGQVPKEAALRQLSPRKLSAQEFDATKIRVEKSARIAKDLRPPYSRQRVEEIRHAETMSEQGKRGQEIGYQELLVDTRGYANETFSVRYIDPHGKAVSEQVVMFYKKLPNGQHEWLSVDGQPLALNADLYDVRLDSHKHAQGIDYRARAIPRVDGRGAYTGVTTIIEDKTQESLVQQPEGRPDNLTSAVLAKVDAAQKTDKSGLEALAASGATSDTHPSVPAHIAEAKEPLSTESLLNRKVGAAATSLACRDQAVGNIQIDTQRRIVPNKPQVLPPETQESATISHTVASLVEEYRQRNEASLIKAKATPGIIDAALINGALVVTYDSSRLTTPADIFGHTMSATSARGEYHDASVDYLGLVMVDINPQKRHGGTVPPSRTIVHELRHHNLALTAYALGQDPDVRMVSGVISSSSALHGKGFSDPPRGMVRVESIKRDYEKYAALLGRAFTSADIENVTQQRYYLDELHSSFLERKLEWFNSKATVYQAQKQGKHWELVGDNSTDQQRTHQLLAHMQAAFVLDTYVFTEIPALPDYIKAMVPRWKELYARMGGIIGSSLTVRQAELLVTQEWEAFKSQSQQLFERNSSGFSGIIAELKKAGMGLEDSLPQLLSA